MDTLDPLQAYSIELQAFPSGIQELILHLVAAHHGYARPFVPAEFVFDPEPKNTDVRQIADEVPGRFERLQRQYGRWGLAYLESLIRAADYAASANPSSFVEVER